MSRLKIHQKIRHSVAGTKERPRLAVFRSLRHLTAQLIDDSTGQTLASASSLKMKGSLLEKAKTVGAELAGKASEQKIKKATFDRGGFRYHGAIKAVAEAARTGGLEF